MPVQINETVFKTKLPLPKLLDMTKDDGVNTGYIDIQYKQHNFAPESPNSLPSGSGFHSYEDVLNCEDISDTNFPIFGCSYHYVRKRDNTSNNSTTLSYGLPFFRFKKNLPVKLQFTNTTGYTYNLHWHGLNTTADIDGATAQAEFGIGTKYGTTYTMEQPPITNNSSLTWVHAHPMFRSSDFLSSGIFGSVDIIDDESRHINENFTYGENYLILEYMDIELDPLNGTLQKTNQYTDFFRAKHGQINGISAVGWEGDNQSFVNPLYHESKKNVVKIAVGNFTLSFRNVFIGVCDIDNTIRQFDYIQSDDGYRNPLRTNMIALAPGNRGAILIDLLEFKEKKAFLFFYNFDLSEVFNVHLNTDTAIVADYQDPSVPNNTPYNPNEEYTQVLNALCPAGREPKPEQFTKKIFLKIKCTGKVPLCYDHIVENIRKLVFGENYSNVQLKQMLKTPNFEANGAYNYIQYLNPKYFHNLPDTQNAPVRKFAFFPDYPDNYYDESNDNANPYGVSGYLDSASRIIVDMWSQSDLDFSKAIVEYNANKNNYKPDVLPSCLFKISSSTSADAMMYDNYMMLGNDILYIDFFDSEVEPYFADLSGNTQYTDCPVKRAVVRFPVVEKPMNIFEWVALVKNAFERTCVHDCLTCNNVLQPHNCDGENCDSVVSDYVDYDWTYYPYKVKFVPTGNEEQTDLNKAPIYLNTVMVKNINKTTQYNIRFVGKWQLLNFFGLPLQAMGCDGMNMMVYPGMAPMAKRTTLSAKCEVSPGGNVNSTMQTLFPSFPDPLKPFATTDSSSGGAIMVGMDDLATFAIPSLAEEGEEEPIVGDNNGIYKGFLDGFANDDFMNFSTKLNGSEKWVYYNMDSQDSHPFHFHLTTGYADLANQNTSSDLSLTPYDQFTYSMDTYAIGSLQQLAIYLKFSNYSSHNAPYVKNVGFMYHCHYMPHHDMSMMGQYFVYENKNDYF